MNELLSLLPIMWAMRDTYGHQDWQCPIDRAAMVTDYRRTTDA